MRAPVLLLVLALCALPLALGSCGSEPAVAADCQCAEGQAGEPVWCAACKKGWVDGKKAHCRGCVEKEVKARMKANAAAKGLPTGAALDAVIAKAAVSLAQEPPKCACSDCVEGTSSCEDGSCEKACCEKAENAEGASEETPATDPSSAPVE